MDRIHRTGTSRAEQGKGAMAVPGAQETMASSLGPATPAGTLLPPPKNVPGASRGYQEPSGARHRNWNMTHSNKTIYRTRHTGQDNPQEQEALLGRARKLRSILAMTWSQGPSQGCLRNRFHLYDRTSVRGNTWHTRQRTDNWFPLYGKKM